MKLNRPRQILLAGLALALCVSHSVAVRGAETRPRASLQVARAQTGLTPVPAAPVPGLSGSPSVPDSPPPAPPADNSNLTPIPQNGSSVPLTPVPIQSQPLNPVPRSPMGLYYGEQDRLDSQMGLPPRTLPAVPYPGANMSPASPPATLDGPPVDGVPALATPDRFGYAPPPGTLGQTYKRRSRLIEEKKHPRVGVVEVNLPEGVDVTGVGLKSKWTGKVWRLESDPLIPGVPHIFEVKASWGEGTEPQYRTVRLIMGRIVDLDF